MLGVLGLGAIFVQVNEIMFNLIFTNCLQSTTYKAYFSLTSLSKYMLKIVTYSYFVLY